MRAAANARIKASAARRQALSSLGGNVASGETSFIATGYLVNAGGSANAVGLVAQVAPCGAVSTTGLEPGRYCMAGVSYAKGVKRTNSLSSAAVE
jgi:hypothetical protein